MICGGGSAAADAVKKKMAKAAQVAVRMVLEHIQKPQGSTLRKGAGMRLQIKGLK